MHWIISLAVLLTFAPARAQEKAKPTSAEKNVTAEQCAFGLLVFCLLRVPGEVPAKKTRARLELFGGYKPFNSYYQTELRACRRAGCELEFNGPSFGFDAYLNAFGVQQGDQFLDIGLSASYLPIVSAMRDNDRGFAGQLGRIDAGEGSLAYVPIRVTMRRPNFLYLITSKYLVSTFGVGLAFPIATGAGTTFTGADRPKITIGGKIGAQVPLGDRFALGVTTNWSVIWYGPSVFDASFQSAYGTHFATLF